MPTLISLSETKIITDSAIKCKLKTAIYSMSYIYLYALHAFLGLNVLIV